MEHSKTFAQFPNMDLIKNTVDTDSICTILLKYVMYSFCSKKHTYSLHFDKILAKLFELLFKDIYVFFIDAFFRLFPWKSPLNQTKSQKCVITVPFLGHYKSSTVSLFCQNKFISKLQFLFACDKIFEIIDLLLIEFYNKCLL